MDDAEAPLAIARVDGEMQMRIRPLELWVFSLFLAIAGVAVLQQHLANDRANAPTAPYQLTVKAHR